MLCLLQSILSFTQTEGWEQSSEDVCTVALITMDTAVREREWEGPDSSEF